MCLGSILGALIGLGAFLLVANLHILVPTNIAWLQGGDPASHYLTWATYRHGPFTFPPGANPAYGLELASSVIFNDEIPLIALSLKPFAAYLSEPFQYFGLWCLACFLLQGAFAWKIGEVLGLPAIPRAILTCLLVFAPPFLARLSIHFALAAHWLVLAALYLYLRPAPRTVAYAWVALLAVASVVQPYIFAMVGVIWVADLIRRAWLLEAEPRSMMWEIGLAVGLVTASLWTAGFFTIGTGLGTSGFGVYRLDLLGPFNPAGWTRILPSFPNAPNEFEGFSYFGLGGLVLIVLAVPALLRGDAAPLLTRRWLPLLVALLMLTLFAISNEVTLATRHLLTLPLPQWTLGLADTFRSSGRMFWPVYYAVLIGVAWLVVRRYGAWAASLLLLAAAILQLIDTSAGWWPIGARMAKAGPSWTTPIQSPWWSAAAKRYKKVRGLPPAPIATHWEVVGYYALTHGLQTDAVYFSRLDTGRFLALQGKAARMMQEGGFDPDTLYVLGDAVFAATFQHLGPDDMLAKIDGLWVFAPGSAALAREFGIEPHPDVADFGLAPPPSAPLAFGGQGPGGIISAPAGRRRSLGGCGPTAPRHRWCFAWTSARRICSSNSWVAASHRAPTANSTSPSSLPTRTRRILILD